jgi:hypothetical protein
MPRDFSRTMIAENYRVGALWHRPVEAGKPARGGVARDAGVDDFDRDALGLERRFESRRKRLVCRELKARGQRIAERHDPDRPLGRTSRTDQPKAHRANGHETLDQTGSLPI